MHIHKQLFLKLKEQGYSDEEASEILGLVLEFVQSAYCQGYNSGYEQGLKEGEENGRRSM